MRLIKWEKVHDDKQRTKSKDLDPDFIYPSNKILFGSSISRFEWNTEIRGYKTTSLRIYSSENPLIRPWVSCPAGWCISWSWRLLVVTQIGWSWRWISLFIECSITDRQGEKEILMGNFEEKNSLNISSTFSGRFDRSSLTSLTTDYRQLHQPRLHYYSIESLSPPRDFLFLYRL